MATRMILLAMASYAAAQTSNAQFNQVINLNGDMNINSITFPDGSRVETFSQTQRQLLVNQNQAPLPGNQVTGSTGNPFVQLSGSSLVIQTNGGVDLVGAQIELAMDQGMLQSQNINPDNTFVAKLAPDRRSWMIMETIRSVNGTDNTVRLVKMNNIDGEYISLGRQTRETSLSLTQFGSALNNAFNVSGSGIQENEFSDGFRMAVRATQPMLINTNVINGISSTMIASLGPQTQSVNNFRYLVNTNLAGVVPNINRMVAVVQLPINPIRLQTVARNMGAGTQSNVRISIAQRGILINPGGAQGTPTQLNKRQNGISNNPAATRLLLSPTFTPIPANAVLDQMNGRLAIPVGQLDGEFIVTVSMSNNGQNENGNNGQNGQLNNPQQQQPNNGQQNGQPQNPNQNQNQGQQNGNNSQQNQQPQPNQQQAPPPPPPPPQGIPQQNAANAIQPVSQPVGQGVTVNTNAAPMFQFPNKRQLPPPPAAVPQSTAGGVVVPMAWIDMMAKISTVGLPVDVGAMMTEYAAAQGINDGFASNPNDPIASLTSGLL